MSANILASTTQILDLLVPLSDADRTRVMRSVQAVVDLTVTTLASDGPVEPRPALPDVDMSKADWFINGKRIHGPVEVTGLRAVRTTEPARPLKEEKPRHAAPKAKPRHRGPQQSADRVRWMTEVPKLLKDKGPMALREIRQQLKVEKDSTLSVVMKALRDSGVVQALGENHLTRVYRLAQ